MSDGTGGTDGYDATDCTDGGDCTDGTDGTNAAGSVHGAPRVVSERDVEPDEHAHGDRTFRQRRLGHAAGGEELGTSLYELEPGRRTWPPHYHAANEEAIYVLDGSLTLWLGSGDGRSEYRLDPGAYVALPTGKAHAHEVAAAGDELARFLVVSTMEEPDFTVQPDRGKVLLIAGDPPGEYEDRYLSKTLDLDAEVDYWEDERNDEPDDDSGGDEDATAAGDGSGTDGGTASDGDRVVSVPELSWTEYDHGDRRFRRKQLGAVAGGEELGTSLYEVPPGKRTFLPHYHAGNEEAVYVLDGAGTVTLGAERRECAVTPGDYVALPAGEAGYHDVRAGEESLRYLMVSTMNEPDVTVYPDDGKVGLYAGSAPGGDPDERSLSTYLDVDAGVDYWE